MTLSGPTPNGCQTTLVQDKAMVDRVFTESPAENQRKNGMRKASSEEKPTKAPASAVDR